MDKPLNELCPPVLVFVKMPKGGDFLPDDAESKLRKEWTMLENWLGLEQNRRLTKSPPMLFDNVWHFTEEKDTSDLRQLVGFLIANVSTYRVCLIHGRLELKSYL